MKEAKGKCHVESVTRYRDLNAEFQDCSENSSNENIIYSDDEDIVGAEADFNNLESSIPVSPIPTTRIHKDHHVSQIIGDMSLTTQTRSMTRAVKDQGGLSHMFVDLPYGKRAIGTKWVHRNKKDERGIVIKNKARLVAQGHTHKEGIDYEEKGHILLVQIYVDDIIFGATNRDLCRSFEKLMKDKFQMSSMRKLTFFLGLQIKQKEDGIFISQDKYLAEILGLLKVNQPILRLIQRILC
nr:copia protein [Tanacetum cinerariifolium]